MVNCKKINALTDMFGQELKLGINSFIRARYLDIDII